MPTLYTFLDVEPFDPSQIAEKVQSSIANIPVRRPLYGLELDKETHATLQILYKDLRMPDHVAEPLPVAA